MTAFHHECCSQQVGKDITGFCPNNVLGSNAEENLIRSLSKFQHGNLEIVKLDEKFISNGSSVFWEEVIIVIDEIPMLLGNNIFKPLEAEILLFSTGNGVLKCNGNAPKLT